VNGASLGSNFCDKLDLVLIIYFGGNVKVAAATKEAFFG
jgi:hypothetical protein